MRVTIVHVLKDIEARLLFVLLTVIFIFSGIVVPSPFRIDPLDIGIRIFVWFGLVVTLLLMASELIFVSRGAQRRESFLYLVHWMLGTGGPYRVIKDGKISVARPLGLSTSEGAVEVVQIESEQVVVFELLGQVTRVVGPGLVFAKPFESIKNVVLTRPKSAKIVISDVYTKDTVPIQVVFSLTYRIQAEPGQTRGFARQYPFSKEAVLKATFNAADWDDSTQKEAQNLVRDKFAQWYLDEIYDPLHPETFPLSQFRGEIEQELNLVTQEWGATVLSFRIEHIEFPHKVAERLLTEWVADSEKREHIIKAEGERVALTKKGEAQAMIDIKRDQAKASARAETIRQLVAAFYRGEQPVDEKLLKYLAPMVGGTEIRAVKAFLKDEEEKEKEHDKPGEPEQKQ